MKDTFEPHNANFTETEETISKEQIFIPETPEMPGTQEAIDNGCLCTRISNDNWETEEVTLSLWCPLHWHYALIKQNECLSEQIDNIYKISEWQYRAILIAVCAAIFFQLFIFFT